MEEQTFLVEAEILCLANAPIGTYEIVVWASSMDKKLPHKKSTRHRLLYRKGPLEAVETVNKLVLSEKFIAEVSATELVTFEVVNQTGSGLFKKAARNGANFSLLATTLMQPEFQKKVTRWYECAPQSEPPAGKSLSTKKSWGRKQSGPLTTGASTSLLVCLSSRQPADVSKLRLSKSSSTGSETVSIRQRRKNIIQDLIEEISPDAIILIYGERRTRDRQNSSVGSAVPESSSTVSSSSSSLAVSKETIQRLGTYTDAFPMATPIYVDISDDESDASGGTGPDVSPPPSIRSSDNGIMFNDWNTDYQSLLEEFSVISNQGSHTRHDTRVVALELAKLEREFLTKAEQYGRIIVIDLFNV